MANAGNNVWFWLCAIAYAVSAGMVLRRLPANAVRTFGVDLVLLCGVLLVAGQAYSIATKSDLWPITNTPMFAWANANRTADAQIVIVVDKSSWAVELVPERCLTPYSRLELPKLWDVATRAKKTDAEFLGFMAARIKVACPDIDSVHLERWAFPIASPEAARRGLERRRLASAAPE